MSVYYLQKIGNLESSQIIKEEEPSWKIKK